MKEIAKLLIFSGIFLVITGIVLLAAGKIPGLGRLPGDMDIRRGNFSFHFPLATSLLLSLILTLILNFFSRR